jgi:hypothetical protein
VINAMNAIGWLLSFPAVKVHDVTHNWVYGPIKNTYTMCRSHQDAYERARDAGDGDEPVHHPPHKEGELHHFHISGHGLVYRNGHRENPHFQYRARE